MSIATDPPAAKPIYPDAPVAKTADAPASKSSKAATVAAAAASSRDVGAAPAQDFVEATVRRGTVVWGGSPVRYVDSGQLNGSGKTIYRQEVGEKPTHSGPGAKVQLPAAEVEALRARGILESPDGVHPPSGIGPVYSVEDGQPAVTEV